MLLFVTGGTGFIGSHFLRAALEAGHHVVALRRPGSRPRVPVPDSERLIWIDGDLSTFLTSPETGLELLGQNQDASNTAFVHLAAHTPNVPYDTLENCLRWNVLETIRLFQRARQAGIGRYIVAGSCFEYGKSAERYEFIPPDAPLEPTLSYPASKAAASVALQGFAREQKVSLLILRVFQVYGEGESSSRFWPSLRRAALSGQDFPMSPGEQVRDFVPVEFVARIFVRALQRGDLMPGEPVVENLGTGRPQTLREFAERLWREWGATGRLLFGRQPYRPGEVMRYVPLVPDEYRQI